MTGLDSHSVDFSDSPKSPDMKKIANPENLVHEYFHQNCGNFF